MQPMEKTLMFVVVKDGKLEIVRTTSVEQAVKSLKTLGVKSQSWKRETSRLKVAGRHDFTGVGGCSVTVHVR